MRKQQQIGSEHMEEGIDLADLFENPGAGPINPFPAKIRPRVKPSRKCSHCHQEGHDRRTCPSRPKCGICRKVGHDRRTCPERIKKAKFAIQPKAPIPKVANLQPQCKCGDTGSRTCITNSCKYCCRSPNCKFHGKVNRRIALGQNNQRFERRQNPVQREKNSVFDSIFSSIPNFFGGLVFLSVLGLILGSAYVAFNALLPVFEEIWAFLEFLWEVVVSIVDFLVAVANFIGSIFEFIIGIFEFIYEILEFIILVFVAAIALVVWLILGILSYAGELLAWIF
tara:strand:- start:76 stop:921 length:846 start_codon:yes stop_codon:yes gene_type:complete